MKSNGKLCPLGKLVVKALADQEKTKSQLAAEIGTSPQYLSYILYGVRSGEKYLPSCCHAAVAFSTFRGSSLRAAMSAGRYFSPERTPYRM